MFRTLAGFFIGVVVTAGSVAVVLAVSSDSEVRVAARLLEDGRVEVAVQQREGEDWSDHKQPNARFLRSDAEVGRWYVSDGVTVIAPDGEPQTAEPTAGPAPEQIYCLVTHQRPGDELFWGLFSAGAHRWDVSNPGVTVMVKHGPTAAEQAAGLRECVDEGAVAVGASLPDPSALRDTLLDLHDSGITIVTFNSGLQDFKSVKSRRHVSHDEVKGGSLAAELLLEEGVTGTVLCVIHEARNIGLDERCDGLEQAYELGAVERVHVTGVGNLEATTEELASRLSSTEAASPGAVITLNTEIGLAAIDAIEQAGSSARLATFDSTPLVLKAISDGRMLFAINTNPSWQAWFALSSLLLHHRTEIRIRHVFGIEEDPTIFAEQTPLLVPPRIYTSENAADWLKVFRRLAEGAASQDTEDGEGN